MVAVLDAIGLSPSAIAEDVGVHRATVHRDLLALKAKGRTLDPAQSGAQVVGVVQRLLAPFLAEGGYLEAMRLVRDEKGRPIKDEGGVLLQQPAVGTRLAATRTFWKVYTESVALQQAFGLVPREPEKVSVEVQIGEDLTELFQAMTGRMSPAGVSEFTKTLRSVQRERAKLLERLGFTS